METLPSEILDLIISHLDIMEIMLFRCVSKSICDTLLNYVKVTKQKHKLINEYKDIKMTKTIINRGIYKVKSKNGKLIGYSTFKYLDTYVLIFVDHFTKYKFISLSNHHIIVTTIGIPILVDKKYLEEIKNVFTSLIYRDVENIIDKLIKHKTCFIRNFAHEKYKDLIFNHI